MIQKYKLKFKVDYWKTTRQCTVITKSIVWDNKQDALDCKALMEKGNKSNGLTIEFVMFTEEEAL